MKNEIVTLLKVRDTLDDDGCKNGEEILQRCDVFAEEKSVTREEYFKALQSGISSDIAFCVNKDEYSGHNKLIYEDAVYRIYRTYSNDVYDIELMCERVEYIGTT